MNDEGWFVTAAHILKMTDDLVKAEQRALALNAQIKTIENDQTISRKERQRRLRTVGRPRPDDAINSSTWFGRDGVLMKEGYRMDNADIGIGRLEPFDPAWVANFPVFKNPSKDFEPGTSLCRMGFPFHRLEPTWDAATGNFHLPLDGPMAIFPNEGIFTRTAEIIMIPAPGLPPIPQPWPLRMIETSSPGIPGQSGGPIFDAEGRVWGIQCTTTSFPLELNTKEKQYLHVGLGVHPDTIFGLLNDRKVRYQVSDS